MIVGVLQGYLGAPTGLTHVLTIIFPTVLTVWVVVMGVLLLRRTREPRPEGLVLSTSGLPPA